MASKVRSMRGVLAPVLTPFVGRSLEPDVKRFLTHCNWLLGKGVSAIM
jgi:dihydrodipicolinate synthase/N-acetylneuraminate lyase